MLRSTAFKSEAKYNIGHLKLFILSSCNTADADMEDALAFSPNPAILYTNMSTVQERSRKAYSILVLPNLHINSMNQ